MQSSLGTNVGGIYFDVSLDTKKMVDEQRRVDAELQKTTKSLDGFEAKLNTVAQAVKAYAAALFVVSQSDAYTKLTAQLRLATDSTRDFEKAQRNVRAIAKEAQTDISGVGTLYARIAQATKELGVSQEKVTDITRTVALALKVSGAGAAESASATLQLSQAFAAGALRGEEFNSVSEAAPRLMQALADGIGVPRGALRAMAEDGKLTSAVLAEALPRALKDLEKEAQQVQTISGAFQDLRNEVMLFVGEQTSASGAASLLANGIGALASNIDTLAAAALGYAAAKLSQTILEASIAAARSASAVLQEVAAHQASVAAQQASRAAAIASTAAKVQEIEATQAGIVAARAEMTAKLASANASAAQAAAQIQAARSAGALSFAIAALREGELLAAAATKARSAALAELAVLGQQQARMTAALTAAQAASTAAMTATTAATSLASRALGLLGGPIGVITTVLGLGVTAWALWGGAAKDAEQKATDAVERSTDEIVADLDKQIAKLKERNSLAAAGMAGIAKQETEAAKKMATLQGQINNLMAGKGVDGGAALPDAARVELLQVLLRQYGTLAGKIQQVGDEQAKLEAAGSASKLSEWMLKYASSAEKAKEEIAKAKKELGNAFTPELEQRIRLKYEPPKKSAMEKFNGAGYLAGLEKAASDGYAKVDAIEREGLRNNQQLLKEGKISRQDAAKATVLIEEDAARERLKISKAGMEDLKKEIKGHGKEVADLEKQYAAERARGVEFAAQLTKAVNPVDALRQEYEAKLQLVTMYEQLMAQAGVDASTQGQITRTEIARQYEIQRQALAEQSFRSQGEAQAFLMDSLNSLSQTATSSIMGLINGTMSAQDAMRGLANTVLNEAVGALVQIGVQQIKNALTAKTLEAAEKARAAANGAVYAASVSAQVAGMTAMAAQNAFAATAAIPIIGPGLAPSAAAAAGAAAASLGAPAVATAPLAGARQYGGPVDAGSMYRVGEGNRPEMFVGDSGRSYMIPGERGKVIGNGDLQRSSPTGSAQGIVGDVNISVAVSVQSDGSAKTQTGTSGADQATARALGERMAAVTKQTMQEELRPGGLLWRMKHGQA